MYRSNWSFNIPPGQSPGHLNFWRLACSNSRPSGQKSRSNAPPLSAEIPLLKDKFRLQSNTIHDFQRGICYNKTFKLLLKTLLREVLTNKGEILSWKSDKPAKTEKTHGRITIEQEKSGSNSPPFQGNVQIPASPGTMHSQMPGVGPGRMLKLQFDRYIIVFLKQFWTKRSSSLLYFNCFVDFWNLTKLHKDATLNVFVWSTDLWCGKSIFW